MGAISPSTPSSVVSPVAIDQGPDTPADYLRHYHLQRDPFLAGESVFFPGAQRQQVLELLQHHCQFSASLLAVIAGPGCGKTHMMQALAAPVLQEDHLCCIDVPLISTVDQVLGQIADSFGLARSEKGSVGQLMSDIRHFGQESQEAESLALVLIDNAHNLDDKALGALLSLLQGQEGCSRRLHVVLFGEPSLASRLDPLQMDDVLIHDLYLPVLKSSELLDYLRFRLALAGYPESDPLPFSLSDIERLSGQSQGHLEDVHELARRQLLESVAPTNGGASGLGLPVPHMLAVVALAAVLLVGLLYRDGTEEPPLPIEVSTSLPAAKTAKLAQPDDAHSMSSEGLSPLEEAPARVDVDIIEPPSGRPGRELAQTELEADIEDSEVRVPSEGLQRVGSQAAGIQQPVLSDDEAHLLRLDAGRATLQVLGVGSIDSVEQFVARQPNRGQIRVYTTRRQGKDWLVLVVGDYRDVAAARRAIATLPSEQRAAGPWPRSLLGVQTDIRVYRGL